MNEADVLQHLKGNEIIFSMDCEKLFKKLAPILSGQWRSLGEQLGIEPHKIESFHILYDEEEEEATVEMLRYWVKHYHPTWHQFEEHIKALPMLNYRYLLKKIDKHISSCIVTTVEIVTQDREWAEQVVQAASETSALRVTCSYTLWKGDPIVRRPTGHHR